MRGTLKVDSSGAVSGALCSLSPGAVSGFSVVEVCQIPHGTPPAEVLALSAQRLVRVHPSGPFRLSWSHLGKLPRPTPPDSTARSTPMPPPRSAPAALFALLWGVATVLHILWPPVFLPDSVFTPAPPPLLAALVLAAVAVILRPAAVWRLLTLAAVQVVDVVYHLPFVSNHWLLAGFVSLGLLLTALAVSLRADRAAVKPAILYETVTPAVRGAVVLFYFFTFFHKLNADFLDPATSCAGTFLGHIVGLAALPPLPALVRPVIVATLAVEGLLVVGLAVPRWRRAACWLGAGFHVLLAFDALKFFYNFSAVMVALLWVCVPCSVARGLLTPRPTVGGVWKRWVRVGRYHFLAVYAVLVGLCWAFPAQSWQLAAYGFTALWLAFAALLLARAWGAGRGWEPRMARLSARPRLAAVLLLLPVLVFVNGASPYLGFKLRSAWQMYSNLNVSAHGSNHYLIPASLDLGGFLADSVRIVAASDPWLHRHYGQTGARMTWFELRRYLARQPDTRLLYVRAGHPPRVFGPTAQEPALTTPPPWLLRKLLIFRPLGPPAAALCDW